jgi:hypothetical protein
MLVREVNVQTGKVTERPYTQKELDNIVAITDDEKWRRVRVERNQLLKDSDHKVFSDYPITAEKKAEWIAYRDKLRTIPQRYTDPSAVIYPVEPK